MIQKVLREDLDIDKYDACIEASIQTNIFGFSWYLDIVCEAWDVYVLEDYQAVMPVPKRKKFFINYVYPPLWVMQLGVYSKRVEDENEFLVALFEDFKFVEYKVGQRNYFSMFTDVLIQKTSQVILLDTTYELIYKKYNRNRRRELTKAKKNDLVEHWEEHPELLIENFKKNVGRRLRNVKEDDYQRLLLLMETCLEKRVGELLCVYNTKKELISAAFFLKYKNRVTELVCSSNFSKRNNGANTFMNDRAIFKYQPHFDLFDFGGSSMKNIRKYYLSFGANDENYFFVKHNNLPKFIKFFKR